MDKEEQRKRLSRISDDMYRLLSDAEGLFFTDHGYHPTSLLQSQHRFQEAVMWLERWIDRN